LRENVVSLSSPTAGRPMLSGKERPLFSESDCFPVAQFTEVV